MQTCHLLMCVSVVFTVLNEAGSLSRLLDSLVAQTRRPDEVVVCDGGSTDGTLSLLEAESRLPLRVIRRPGANISQGRNAAIEAAAGEIVAVTDAGVRLSQQWLEKIIAPFEDAETQTVAGFFVPAPQTVFETAMGATVLPEAREIDPASFNPSSRSVAFRKSAWAMVGGYPEWLDYCEDLIFDFRLRERLGPFLFAPEALVYFRPRSNLRAFFTQYYRYARGDGKADLWRRRHTIRYLTYLVAAPLIAIAGALVSPWWWALYLISAPGMFWAGWRRLARMWDDLNCLQKLQAALWVPVIRVTGDVAKMVGYPAGLWWRWRKTP
ncbi:MAG: glycosyltransferase [Chloroflexota bacterium]|nr:glycosyltransferase [Chloroflexota bacterium]